MARPGKPEQKKIYGSSTENKTGKQVEQRVCSHPAVGSDFYPSLFFYGLRAGVQLEVLHAFAARGIKFHVGVLPQLRGVDRSVALQGENQAVYPLQFIAYRGSGFFDAVWQGMARGRDSRTEATPPYAKKQHDASFRGSQLHVAFLDAGIKCRVKDDGALAGGGQRA